MSSVIHPVGPEPSETYWVRRAIIVGVALLLVIVLLVVLINRNAGQQPAPAAPPGSPSPTETYPSSSRSESPSPSVSPSSSASASVTSSTSASASRSASSSASGSAAGSATAKPSGGTSAGRSASASPSGSASTADASPAASSSAAATDQKSLVICNPAQLRPTLTAPERSVKAKKSLTFSMSLINGSDSTCVITKKPTDFELKIYSGSDRIWSTNDCPGLVTSQLAEVAPEKSLQWKISWNGRRSARGCENKSAIPRPGTYWATAQFTGSKPVQFRFLVKEG